MFVFFLFGGLRCTGLSFLVAKKTVICLYSINETLEVKLNCFVSLLAIGSWGIFLFFIFNIVEFGGYHMLEREWNFLDVNHVSFAFWWKICPCCIILLVFFSKFDSWFSKRSFSLHLPQIVEGWELLSDFDPKMPRILFWILTLLIVLSCSQRWLTIKWFIYLFLRLSEKALLMFVMVKAHWVSLIEQLLFS